MTNPFVCLMDLLDLAEALALVGFYSGLTLWITGLFVYTVTRASHV
jgi:hypothetical protein